MGCKPVESSLCGDSMSIDEHAAYKKQMLVKAYNNIKTSTTTQQKYYRIGDNVLKI